MTDEILIELLNNFDDKWDSFSAEEKVECVVFMIDVLEDEIKQHQSLINKLEYANTDLGNFLDEELIALYKYYINKTKPTFVAEMNNIRKLGSWIQYTKQDMFQSVLSTHVEELPTIEDNNFVLVSKSIANNGYKTTRNTLANFLARLNTRIKFHEIMIEIYTKQLLKLKRSFSDEVSIIDSKYHI